VSLAETSFYITGGTLRHDAPSYVERQADKDLLDGLLKGEFCYVLTSRQMGKSSLMVRTAQKLRAQGINVVALDLTAIGQNLTPEQWYDGLIVSMGRQLRLEDELEALWMKNTQLSPVQRLMLAIRDVALIRRPGPLVVFVDEIDIVVSLPFASDEFFAAIRECYNRRAEEPELGRLRFCLLGVATPSDLIRDARLTPFNIGQRIELSDFTNEEAAPLEQGLNADGRQGQKLLRRVLYWTSGHPYLTQRLCRTIAEDSTAASVRDVDRLCRELFLSSRARERDDNLLFVRERLVNGSVSAAAVLTLHLQVLAQRQPVADSEKDPALNALRLSGVVRSAEGRMQIRNRIYRTVFDREWALSNLPDQEARRQRWAYRRGFATALKGVGFIALLLVAAAFGWRIWSNITPEVTIPDPKLPSPNAFDSYQAAVEAINDSKWLVSIVQTDEPLPAEVESLVQKNANALGVVRAGLLHQYRHPPVRSFDHKSEELSGMMNLAHLFVLEAQMKKARSNWTAASQSYLDVIHLGEDLSRGSPIIGRLVSLAVSAMGIMRLAEIIDQLSADDAKNASRVVQQTMGRRVPMTETLQEEKWMVQASLLELFRKPNWRLGLAPPVGVEGNVLGPDEQTNGWEKAARFLITFPYTKHEVMDAYTRYIDGWISRVSDSFLLHAEPFVDAGPFNSGLAMSSVAMRSMLTRDTYVESQLSLLAASLALRAYKLEKRAYPSNLVELIPDYLERIPKDPFDARKALHYKNEQTNYVLYSLGPDRVDNGGTESTDRFFDTNQKGDIRLKVRRPDRPAVKK